MKIFILENALLCCTLFSSTNRVMRKRFADFWQNYKFRFVPWIILNLRQSQKGQSHFQKEALKHRKSKALQHDHSDRNHCTRNKAHISAAPAPKENIRPSSSSMIVQHVHQGDDKHIQDEALLQILVDLFKRFLQAANSRAPCNTTEDIHKRNMEIMHDMLGYSIERRKSTVADDAGTGVFLASGYAKPGSLIALYPGTIYMPSEPLFFPSIGNPFIFRCSDRVHIDGNDRWLSKSIFKSCAARDKFRMDLPCCDESWLTPFPGNPLSIGQYVNNRSRSSENNVVYQESTLTIEGSQGNVKKSTTEFPVHLCKFLPNVWANPGNNNCPLRLVPLVASSGIEKGEEILSSYFTLVHSKSDNNGKQQCKKLNEA